MTELVNVGKEGQTMDSREISDLTGKRHPDVKRDIEAQLGKIGDASIFAHIYKDSMNRDQTSYKLPYRETMILISGYSVELRAKVVDRWMVLEQEKAKPISLVDARIDRLENMVEKLVLAIAQNMTVPNTANAITQEYFSILAYCRNNGLTITTDTAKTIGMECRKRSIKMEKIINTVPDERWGKVNSYHIDVLVAVFAEWQSA